VKYHNEVKGFNSRLDEMQAAFLRVKLRKLDEWNAQRKDLAAAYLTALPADCLVLPFVPEWADPVWHVFVVRHAKRDLLQQKLQEANIGTVIHYPIPPHFQPAYAELDGKAGDFPIAEAIHREVLSLPMGPTMTLGQADRVVHALRSAISTIT
jgi:dTDP-4-amino-4,6-dideoxygalactose transaminase